MTISRTLWGLLAFSAASVAAAQESSLYRQPVIQGDDRRGLTLNETSFMYQAHLPPKELKINDIIMVVVDEKSQVTSKADIDTKRKGNLNATVTDWIKFKGLSVHADKLVEGDPAINGKLDSEFKGNSELKTKDGMGFRIAARIVDVRPNGTFVIEAHRTIQNNEETWEQSLTGVVRREDVLADMQVKSERVAELQILKRETGHVRDGYRRGWLTKIWDSVSPF